MKPRSIVKHRSTVNRLLLLLALCSHQLQALPAILTPPHQHTDLHYQSTDLTSLSKTLRLITSHLASLAKAVDSLGRFEKNYRTLAADIRDGTSKLTENQAQEILYGLSLFASLDGDERYQVLLDDAGIPAFITNSAAMDTSQQVLRDFLVSKKDLLIPLMAWTTAIEPFDGQTQQMKTRWRKAKEKLEHNYKLWQDELSRVMGIISEHDFSVQTKIRSDASKLPAPCSVMDYLSAKSKAGGMIDK